MPCKDVLWLGVVPCLVAVSTTRCHAASDLQEHEQQQHLKVGVADREDECTCDRFCSGECAPFFSRTLPPRDPSVPNVMNLTLFRFTPRAIAHRLADTNTGDLDGDLGFFFDRFALGDRCRAEPTDLRCFLAPWR